MLKLTDQVVLAALFLGLSVTPGCGSNPQRDKQRYFDSGQRYFEQGKYAEATIQFRNALQIDPHFVEVYRHLGQAYYELQRWPEAAEALSQAIEFDPQNLKAHFLLGEVYLNARDYQSAEREAAFILQKDSSNAAAYQLRGAAFVASGQKERALESFQEITKLLPDDPSSYINVAMVEIGLQHFDSAEKHLRKAEQIAPHAIPIYLNLASLFRQENRLPDVEAVLQDGVKSNPDSRELQLDLADTLYAEGKDQLADRVVENFRENKPKSADGELAVGDLYFGRKKLDLAEAAYKRALQMAPDKLDLKQRLVEIDLSRPDLKSARALNDEILRKDPANLTSHIARARILMAEGKNEEAITELRQQLAVAPSSPQAHYFLGLAYWHTNGPGPAESEFRRATDLDPKLLSALHSLAELQLSRGEKGAIEPASRCVSLRPFDPAEHLLLGRAYLQGGEINKAREQFTVSQQLAPHDARVRFGQALTSVSEHKLEEAGQELEAALRLDPQFTQALGKLVELDVQEMHRGKGVDRVKEYLATNPNSAQAHLILGSLYMSGEEFDAAKTEFERAIQIDPNLVSAYLNLGRINQEAGQSDLAIRQYQSALALQPQFVPLVTLLGNIYMEKGDMVTAQSYFEKALAINPNFAVAASNLAWVYAQQGVNLDVALGLARRANEQLPDLDSVTDILGWVQYKNGQYSAAVPLLEECVQKAPSYPVYHYHLGMALVAGGQKEKGREELQAALRLNLAGEDAHQARGLLTRLR
jgi:tetratricopeptide (TPR) repeat protein